MSTYRVGRIASGRRLFLRTAVAFLGFVILAAVPLVVIEQLLGVGLPYGFALVVFIVVLPLSFSTVALVVFCSSRELDIGGDCIEEPRPPWQPTIVLGLALPLLAALLDADAGALHLGTLSWIGAALGGSAGLANYFIRDWDGYRHA